MEGTAMTPIVSVTIPTYNRSTMVKEAIDSVLAQTSTDIEVVVVDDGSTDDTRTVVESIDDDRVRYYYKPNGGCASGRNMGIRQCRGKYIGFLDSDDLWPANFIEVMLAHLENKPDYGCAYCPVRIVRPDGQSEDSIHRKRYRSGWVTKDMFTMGTVLLQTAFFRAAALEGIVFDETMRNGADTDALLRLSTRVKFLFVPDIRVTYRIGHDLSPRKDFSVLNCNRIRSLERFYYRLGGNRVVPWTTARRKLSHAYRAAARNHSKLGSRSAAILLLRQAIRYWPIDARLYRDLLKARRMSKGEDPNPRWAMPAPLPPLEW
jgi:glycosyltransferase involved in cell wall biosynthesis